MAQAINYASIAPASTTPAAGAKAASSNFSSAGRKLKASKAGAQTSTPAIAAGSDATIALPQKKRPNGPQPLRLPPGKLFFGYEIKPVRKKDADGAETKEDTEKTRFQGQGQSLRGGAGSGAKGKGQGGGK